MRVPFLGFLVLSALLSGCIGNEDAPTLAAGTNIDADQGPSTIEAEYAAAAVYATDAPDFKYGFVRGFVLTDERQPIQGATVRIVAMNREVVTPADGSFRFDRIGAAAWTVLVTQSDYEPKTVRFEIRPDQETYVEVFPQLLPDLRPYVTILHRQGQYDCAMVILIPGDCAATWLAGKDDGVTKENFTFPFKVEYPWYQLLLELTWDTSGNNQLEGMRLKLSPDNGTVKSNGEKYRIAIADGNEQPLRILLTAGDAHETAENYTGTNTTVAVPVTGGPLEVIAYPRGKLEETTKDVCDPDGRCAAGVGAGVNLKFDVYASTFYNQRMPEGFTAVGIS